MADTQLRHTGNMPTEVECFVGALMFSTLPEVREVLRYVADDDVDAPARTVLASIRTLTGQGIIPSPQLVSDDLQRRGQRTRQVATWLAAAATSGACASAARHYAGAVVAVSFRRRVNSFGEALRNDAAQAAETDVAYIAERAATNIAAVYGRLQHLRGDAE